MFDELIKELKRLEEGFTVEIPITPDEKGYIDKECPRDECKFIFKVKEEDWAGIFKDEAVYCPRCREEATSNHWLTTEQKEAVLPQARVYGLAEVQERIDNALRKGVVAFNRKQPRNAFVKLSLSVTSQRPTKPVLFPPMALDVMEQEIQCEECSARFAVVGCAYFCPACGYNSVERTFDDSLFKVEGKLNNIETIRSALVTTGMKDEAENTRRSMIESCFSDCVVAFQRLAEQLYIQLPGNPPTPRNAFQNLQLGSSLWRGAIAEGYEEWITRSELDILNVFFQRRHLLAHTEGMVDQLYIERSNDTSYRLRQRIVVTESDARQMLLLVRKLANALREALQKLT